MSRNWNLHSFACDCPWCFDMGRDVFKEEDIILIDISELKSFCADPNAVITDAQIDRWAKS